MNKTSRITAGILAFILIGTILFIASGFVPNPVQKYYAEKQFNDYITLQGTSSENIESKKIYKDTKTGGYNINIEFKDDPDHRYEYHYFSKRKDMICIVYNELNSSVPSGKYRPLE